LFFYSYNLRDNIGLTDKDKIVYKWAEPTPITASRA